MHRMVCDGRRVGRPTRARSRAPHAARSGKLRPHQNLHFNTTYELVATNGLEDVDRDKLTDGPEQVLNRFTTEVLTLTGRLGTAFAKDEALFDASRLFVLDRDLGLLTVNIASKAQPSLLATTPVLASNLGGHQALALGRDFLYEDATGTLQRSPILVVVGWESVALEGVRGHLRVFDVANPEAPQLIGRLQLSDHTAGTPMRVLVVAKDTPGGRQHFALVGEITAGVVVVDLQRVVEQTLHPERSLPGGGTQVPALVGLFAIPGGLPANPAGLVPYRGDALYLDLAHGLFRLDLSNLPAIRGTLLDTIPSAYRLTVVEDFQVGTDSLNQPILKDFAIVGTVTAVTLVDLGTGQRGGTVALSPGDVTTGLAANPRQGLVFVAAAGGGFKVVDIRDPDRPALLGAVPAADAPGRSGVGVTGGGIAQDGIYAYLTSGPEGLQVVKYNDPGFEIVVTSPDVARDLDGNGLDGLFLIKHLKFDIGGPPTPVMPAITLKARRAQGVAGRRDVAKVRWEIALDHRITVPPRPDRNRFLGKSFRDEIRGRIECDGLRLPSDPDRENCGWPIAVIESELDQEIRIDWPTVSGEDFVGGGELHIQAMPIPGGAREPDRSRTVEALLTTATARFVFLNNAPYERRMSPGSDRPRIEGQLLDRLNPDPALPVNQNNRLRTKGNAVVDPGFRADVVAYLENQTTSGDIRTKVQGILDAVRPPGDTTPFFRIIAYLESLGDARYAHFRKLQFDSQTITAGQTAEAVYPALNAIGKKGKPKSTDGGFGLMQLTEPPPLYSQVWHWRKNIDAAIDRIDGKLNEAQDKLSLLRLADRSREPGWLRFETYQRYNGGEYWTLDDRRARWLGPDPKLNKYADRAAQIETSRPPDF